MCNRHCSWIRFLSSEFHVHKSTTSFLEEDEAGGLVDLVIHRYAYLSHHLFKQPWAVAVRIGNHVPDLEILT